MTALSLNASSRAYLTKTTVTPNPNGSGPDLVNTFLCDIDGTALINGAPPLPVYRDVFTGKTFVRVAENIPTGVASADVAEALRLTNLKPVHYVSADGDVKGWFIEAPDFNGREGKPSVIAVPVEPVVLLESSKKEGE